MGYRMDCSGYPEAHECGALDVQAWNLIRLRAPGWAYDGFFCPKCEALIRRDLLKASLVVVKQEQT